jgi:hypothetical protein
MINIAIDIPLLATGQFIFSALKNKDTRFEETWFFFNG